MDHAKINERVVCDSSVCNGCFACEAVCPRNAVSIRVGVQRFFAEVDVNRCIDCGRCISVCSNHICQEFKQPIAWYQGWAENTVRSQSSSGGFATKLSEAFLKAGGQICSCTYADGAFTFRIHDGAETLRESQGSKYVKSNPRSAYKEVKELLQQGKKVLYIALPCQVAAMKAVVGARYEEKLYTADLICHGSPSPKVLEMFLMEQNIRLRDVKTISFRNKTNFGIQADGRELGAGVPDKYTTAFMEGLCFTENCYACRYARLERVSDITLGDSWGSEMETESKQGISLLLCMTRKGLELAESIQTLLKPVDLEKATASNQQLIHPSKKPKAYQRFFDMLVAGRPFSHVVRCCALMTCARQDIKGILIRLHILPWNAGKG